MLFTDTVGFIQTSNRIDCSLLSNAGGNFSSGLAFTCVDITHVNASAQAKSVQETLVEIGAGDIPIITALNKIDGLKDPQGAIAALEDFPNTFPISALTGQGLGALLSGIEEFLYETFIDIDVQIPYDQGQLLSLFYEKGQVKQVVNQEFGTRIIGLIPRRFISRYEPYFSSSLKNSAIDEDDFELE